MIIQTPHHPPPNMAESIPEFPFITPRIVDRRYFQGAQWVAHSGVDPQSIPRVVLPCVYVLRLPSNTGPWYYVGLSADVGSRIGQHFAGSGSKLTRRFPPDAVMCILYSADKAAEEDTVRLLCEHFGGCGAEGSNGPKIRGGRHAGASDRPPYGVRQSRVLGAVEVNTTKR